MLKSFVEFYRQYDSLKDKVWVVESQDRRVGFLCLMHRPENQAQLSDFILEKAFRGLGLGNQLMEEWMVFYRQKGYKRAHLYTTSGLDPAVHLHEKYGFRKESEKYSENFGVHLKEMLFRLS